MSKHALVCPRGARCLPKNKRSHSQASESSLLHGGDKHINTQVQTHTRNTHTHEHADVHTHTRTEHLSHPRKHKHRLVRTRIHTHA